MYDLLVCCGSLISSQLLSYALSRLPQGKAFHSLALFRYLLQSARDTGGLLFLREATETAPNNQMTRVVD